MKKSLLRKRLLMLSALLLTACGQMWAGRSGVEVASGITNSIRYTLYSDYSYYYDDPSYSCNLGGVAVITSFSGTQMIIPETLGGCSQIVIGSGALTSSVRDLQISKSVKLLEFNAVYNAVNMESLTIADGTTLVCFGAGTPEQSMQNGSFSYLKKLQSVYLGGNLEYDDYSTKYNAPFYNLNTEQAFSLTIGPNVTSIPEDCFGNCDDVKSIKAMPQTPPTIYYNALGNTSAAVPVYVSYKTKSAYTSASGWSNFTNYVLDTDLCKADALNDLDAEAGENPSATVQGVVSDYKNKVNAATSGADVVTNLNAGKLAIQLQKAKDIAIAALNAEAGNAPSQTVANVRDTWIANVNKATTVDEVNTQKEKGIAAIQLQKAKETAIAALTEAKVANPSGAADGIFNTYKARIEAATSIDMVTAAKAEGIQKLQEYVATLEAEKASAKAELDAAKSQYPSEYADDIVNKYKVIIEDATTIEAVEDAKEEGIQALMDAKDLQDAKEAAISDLNDAKKDYPSDESEDIVSIYTYKINAATSTDAVTAIKNEGIQALAYAAEIPTVLHINFAEGSAPIEKEHFMTASKFRLDEDCNVVLTVNGNSVTYPWDMVGKITLFKGAPTVELKANKDPNGSEYYTTFYSSLESYTIPEDVKAYTATVDEQDGVIILSEIKDEVIPAKTAVVLISTSDSYSANTCAYTASGTEKGILQGKDVETPVPDDNCYVLSGTSKLGMGLYPWTGTGKTLAANKAYLQLTEVSLAKAFTFVIDGETTSIESLTPTLSEGEGVYNLQGIRVNDSYKGIVIRNGKKTLNK